MYLEHAHPAFLTTIVVLVNIHFNKVKETNIFRKWSPSGEYFEILGIVSGGFRYADDIYCFIAHSEVKTENRCKAYCQALS